MARETRIWLGSGVLLAGLAPLAARLAGPLVWRLAWPTLLVLAGLAALWRARSLPSARPITWRLLGDIERWGAWAVQDESLYVLIGDVSLDLTAALAPIGVSTITCYGLVGDIRVRAPQELTVAVEASALVGEVHVDGRHEKLLWRRVALLSPGTGEPEHRVVIKVVGLAADVHIVRAQAAP
jgi:hypothetical protein